MNDVNGNNGVLGVLHNALHGAFGCFLNRCIYLLLGYLPFKDGNKVDKRTRGGRNTNGKPIEFALKGWNNFSNALGCSGCGNWVLICLYLRQE
jgi:hypothetical protein